MNCTHCKIQAQRLGIGLKSHHIMNSMNTTMQLLHNTRGSFIIPQSHSRDTFTLPMVPWRHFRNTLTNSYLATSCLLIAMLLALFLQIHSTHEDIFIFPCWVLNTTSINSWKQQNLKKLAFFRSSDVIQSQSQRLDTRISQFWGFRTHEYDHQYIQMDQEVFQ